MNLAELDKQMMERALKEAAKGRPSPNPHVGAVIAKGDDLVSVGHHARCGGPHAEVVAIRRAGEQARGGTLYVTLEPCNHFGRTGPCTEAIIKAGLRRVVIGCPDPAPHKPGASKRLRAAGIELEVVAGAPCECAKRLIQDFSKVMLTGLPLVTLKAAITLDGRMATRTGDSKWITGQAARREAHRLRARSDAIMVGVGTVLADDPQLTVRNVRGPDPVRVVLDSRLRTPPDAAVIRHTSKSPTLIFHAPDPTPARKRRLQRPGVELIAVHGARGARKNAKGSGLSLRRVLRELAHRGVVSLLCEGGSRVHGTLLEQKLADRAAIFVAPKILADPRAIPLAAAPTAGSASGPGFARIANAWQLCNVQTRRLESDMLVCGDIVRATKERRSKN